MIKGQGIVTYQNGVRYEGAFSNNNKCGEGILTN
jgi:hypothetical protein